MLKVSRMVLLGGGGTVKRGDIGSISLRKTLEPWPLICSLCSLAHHINDFTLPCASAIMYCAATGPKQ